MRHLPNRAVIKRTYNDVLVFPFFSLHLIFTYIHVCTMALNVSPAGSFSCVYNIVKAVGGTPMKKDYT